jgi:hypothetical protein
MPRRISPVGHFGKLFRRVSLAATPKACAGAAMPALTNEDRMRLRCPQKNCPIDVPDDLVGVRIRCPHCGAWLDVDEKYREPSDEQIQASMPVLSFDTKAPKPKPAEPIKLENQIYDGLPPLSLMIALHQRKGHDADANDYASRYPMTEDDWKALSAFESILLAVISLRITLVVGAAALVVNLLVWTASVQPTGEHRGVEMVRPLTRAGTPILLGVFFLLIYLGCQALRRIKLGTVAPFVPWAAVGVALVVGGNALLDLLTIFGSRQEQTLGFLIFLSVPFNVIAAFDSGKSAWRVGRSLDQVSPPEISHRLTEALKYLE